MNKEEITGKLQMVYVGDINALNELIGYYDGLKEENQKYKEVIKEAMKIVEYRLKENDGHINARMEMFHYRNLKEILSKGVE